MGFDNECILDIQSLNGEYFCPVCRLLVYPNEALQSQCTHLYCKPCLTYTVSTTRACPYDGYLVTEADSKPLVESNKALAETIGKINVHCLYHRSGCTWQGPLSECTSHCSGCAFGNSPVVCNRCAIQIVHRQVQEHALNCPGVPSQSQAQPAEVAQSATAAGLAASSNQNQAGIQAAATSSQAQTSQTMTTSAPGQDPNQQINSTNQAQASMQPATQTAEQWYQQQQQYQQYYQQYPGYEPYQQHYQQYNPYQQQAVSQYQQQPQVHMQLQTSQAQLQAQPQAHSQVQQSVVAPNQNLAQVNTHPTVQLQSQIQLKAQAPQVQMPPYQQPYIPIPHPQPQVQAQTHLQLHPLLHSQAQPHLQTQLQTQVQHHQLSVSQPISSQLSQPLNPNLQHQVQHPSTHAVTGHQSYPQPQPQLQPPPQPQPQPYQMPVGTPQHPVHMHLQTGPQPQQQHLVQMQSQFPQQSSVPRPPQSYATTQSLQQPGLLPSPVQAQTIPAVMHQPVHPRAQQPGLPVNQPLVVQQVQQTMHQQPFSGHPLGPLQSQVYQQSSYVQQLHAQPQLRPQGLPQSFQQPYHAYPQPHNAQGLAARPLVPIHGVPTQPYPQSAANLPIKSNQGSADNHFGTNQVQLSSEQESVATSRPMSDGQGDHITEKGGETELAILKDSKKDPHDFNQASDESKPIGDAKDATESLRKANGGSTVKQVKQERTEDTIGPKDISNVDHKEVSITVTEDRAKKEEPLGDQSMNLQKQIYPTQESGSFPAAQDVSSVPISRSGPIIDQGKQQLFDLQRRPVPEPPHLMQLPGAPSTQLRPLGQGHIPHPGAGLHLPPENLQHPLYKQSQVPGASPAGIPVPESASLFGRHGPTRGAYSHMPLSQGDRPSLYGREAEFFSASTVGLRDDRFRPLADEHRNSFPPDPAQNMVHQGEIGDLKRFPRPSDFNTEPDPKFASHFSASRSLDKASHGFGIDAAPRPLGKGPHVEAHGGAAMSRFFPPYLHPNDVGEQDTTRSRPNFRGSGSGYGQSHMDGLAARSPGRGYPGLSSRGFGDVPGLDDIDGRESHRFNDPIGGAFRESRFPVLPLHSRRGEFDRPGRDGLPNHLWRGEHFGPRNLPGHLQLGETLGYDPLSSRSRFGDLDGPENFGNPRIGEPGFRSSFSLKGFPGFGGHYTGNMESFDNLRKRKPSSMGWCRICKVDCETVEGLEMHSQTREHQKMAMDMVVTIKQNAKKQKFTPGDHSSIDDGSKSRTASLEGSGNKH